MMWNWPVVFLDDVSISDGKHKFQTLVLQERLGEIPGQDDHRTGGRNEQHLGNDTKQTGQTGQAEHGQGGH